jgi:hypothetical protein
MGPVGSSAASRRYKHVRACTASLYTRARSFFTAPLCEKLRRLRHAELPIKQTFALARSSSPASDIITVQRSSSYSSTARRPSLVYFSTESERAALSHNPSNSALVHFIYPSAAQQRFIMIPKVVQICLAGKVSHTQNKHSLQ